MISITHIVGARPNFMKVAPVYRALAQQRDIDQSVVHTGQHYDPAMSQVFFDQLGLPTPVVNLDVGSGSHARQTADVMVKLESRFLAQRPDRVLVYGDVNSTVAAALVCAKLGVRFAHVEAGLRSNDRTMPEEVNRLVTDQLADVLLTPSIDADANLRREGIAPEKIHFVGNVMIDSLVRILPSARAILAPMLRTLGMTSGNGLPADYGLVTLHRPANADDIDKLRNILTVLADISRNVPLIFPVHPRTRQQIAMLDIESVPNFRLIEPLGYQEFTALQCGAQFLVTDSGGVQEESTYLGVPCLTMRKNTERPITVSVGTSQLIGDDLGELRTAVERIRAGEWKRGTIPPLWDGHAGERIAEVLSSWRSE